MPSLADFNILFDNMAIFEINNEESNIKKKKRLSLQNP